MSRQIIEQPNGKYCIFSSVVDSITHYDMTEKEIVKLWTKEQEKEIKKKVELITSKLKDKQKPYYQFTINYEEMINHIQEVHGKEEMMNVKKTIEK